MLPLWGTTALVFQALTIIKCGNRRLLLDLTGINWNVQTSLDGITFTTVGSGTVANRGGNVSYAWEKCIVSDPNGVKARYVRFNILTTYDTRGYKWAITRGMKYFGSLVMNERVAEEPNGNMYFIKG